MVFLLLFCFPLETYCIRAIDIKTLYLVVTLREKKINTEVHTICFPLKEIQLSSLRNPALYMIIKS